MNWAEPHVWSMRILLTISGTLTAAVSPIPHPVVQEVYPIGLVTTGPGKVPTTRKFCAIVATLLPLPSQIPLRRMVGSSIDTEEFTPPPQLMVYAKTCVPNAVLEPPPVNTLANENAPFMKLKNDWVRPTVNPPSWRKAALV